MSSVLLLCPPPPPLYAPPFMLFTLNIKTIHLLHRLLLFQRNTKVFTAQLLAAPIKDSNSLFWARAAWLISSPCRSAKLVSAACNHNLSPVVSTHSLCADVLYSYLFITEELKHINLKVNWNSSCLWLESCLAWSGFTVTSMTIPVLTTSIRSQHDWASPSTSKADPRHVSDALSAEQSGLGCARSNPSQRANLWSQHWQ